MTPGLLESAERFGTSSSVTTAKKCVRFAARPVTSSDCAAPEAAGGGSPLTCTAAWNAAAVRIGELARMLGRHDLHLADERRIAQVFSDCELGAVPALGMAWGLETVVDAELDDCAVVYMEAGDHERLVCVSHEQFERLMQTARHGRFGGLAMH